MAIPDHEKTVKKTAGKRVGNRSGPLEVLRRVTELGQMMHIRGMTLTEIYSWNMDPARAIHPETGEPLPGGNPWGYSFSQISQMTKRAQKLGASLICKSHEEAVRRALRDLYDLKSKATAGGDYRVAFLCMAQINKIQATWIGKAQKAKGIDPGGSPKNFDWGAPKQIPVTPVEIVASTTGFEGMMSRERFSFDETPPPTP